MRFAWECASSATALAIIIGPVPNPLRSTQAQTPIRIRVHAHWKPAIPRSSLAHSVCGLDLRQTTRWPPLFPSLVERPLAGVIISEMFWLAFAFYADLLAVVVLWQICFAHFWCDSHSSAAPEARSPKLDARCPMPDGRGPHFPSMCGLNLPKSFISSNLVLHLFDLLNLHTCIWAISVAGAKADCVRAERFRPQSLGINQCLWNSLNHAACNGEAWLMA